MKKLIVLFALTASPALAASGPFLSLKNTNFVVLIAFLLFLGVLLYMKVPAMVGKMLDKRAEDIRGELDEAKALREEAQSILASYERKQREVEEQAQRIVAHAKEEAEIAAKQAKEELEQSIARRLQAAEDRIASAEASALREVKDRAVSVAIAVASEAIAKQMNAAQGNKLIDDAIKQVESKLH